MRIVDMLSSLLTSFTQMDGEPTHSELSLMLWLTRCVCVRACVYFKNIAARWVARHSNTACRWLNLSLSLSLSLSGVDSIDSHLVRRVQSRRLVCGQRGLDGWTTVRVRVGVYQHLMSTIQPPDACNIEISQAIISLRAIGDLTTRTWRRTSMKSKLPTKLSPPQSTKH